MGKPNPLWSSTGEFLLSSFYSWTDYSVSNSLSRASKVAQYNISERAKEEQKAQENHRVDPEGQARALGLQNRVDRNVRRVCACVELGLLSAQDGKSLAELDNLHVLVGVVNHGQVLHPLEPVRDVGGQIAAEQLGGECVEGGHGDGDLHVHAAGTHEESHALEQEQSMIMSEIS